MKGSVTVTPTTYRLAVLLLLLFVSVEVFEGALRYFLATVSLSSLIYIPKLLIAVAAIVVLMRASYTSRIDRVFLSVLLFFAAFEVVGMHFTHSWFQPAFGAFVLMPLILAVLAEPAFAQLRERLVPYAAILWLCVAIGVAYDYMADVPWADLIYQIGGVSIQASRSWATMLGTERVAGFSRASFDAANQLIFLALPWVIMGRRKSLSAIIWVATGLLVVLTTTKRAVGVYVLLTLLLALIGPGVVSGKLKRLVGVTCPAFVALIGIALPASTIFINYGRFVDGATPVLLTSFLDRLTSTWPDALALLADHGNVLLGRGIGGIGVSQSFFEPLIYSPADNLYVYLYVSFGIFGIALAWLYVSRICRINLNRDKWAQLMWFWAIAALTSGWAVNGVEGALSACVFGITLRYAWHDGHARKSHEQGGSSLDPADNRRIVWQKRTSFTSTMRKTASQALEGRLDEPR